MNPKIASEEIKDILGVLMFDIVKMQSYLKEHDLGMTESWFYEIEKDVSRIRNILKECDRRLDYGEDWDQ